MATINRQATFACPIDKVWNTVTDLSNQAWRSDIDKVEVIDDVNFIEYTKDGFKTAFKTETKQHHKIWEFSIENKNIIGKWSGKFYSNNGYTTLDFTEDVKAKNILLSPFVKRYLMKQQRQYFIDLKKALDCQ